MTTSPLTLNYLALPAGLALACLKGDLSKVEKLSEYKTVVAHWRLAANRFKRDMQNLRGQSLCISGYGDQLIDKYQVYQTILETADKCIQGHQFSE